MARKRKANPESVTPPSRGGRPRKKGELVPVFTLKARNLAWKDWFDRFAASEGIERTKLVDAALATHAAIRRFEPPPDREA